VESGRSALEAFRPVEQLLARAKSQVGRPLFVRSSRLMKDALTEVRGTAFPFGLTSPAFTDGPDTPFGAFQRPKVMVVKCVFEAVSPLISPLEVVARANVSLAIFCEAAAGDALAMLAVNRERKTISVAALAPTRPPAGFSEFDKIARAAGTRVMETPGGKLEAFGAFESLAMGPGGSFAAHANGPDTALVLDIGGTTLLEAGLKFRMALERMPK
jgi:hypothetical protein